VESTAARCRRSGELAIERGRHIIDDAPDHSQRMLRRDTTEIPSYPLIGGNSRIVFPLEPRLGVFCADGANNPNRPQRDLATILSDMTQTAATTGRSSLRGERMRSHAATIWARSPARRPASLTLKSTLSAYLLANIPETINPAYSSLIGRKPAAITMAESELGVKKCRCWPALV
jgi:hypothetical protein